MKYIRQVAFDKIGKNRQRLLEGSKVTIIGLGATGTATTELLIRAGIKNLTLIDRDLIDITNLQRQKLFTEQDIGKPKVIIAKKILQKINSKARIKTYFTDLNYKNINRLIKTDLILDCTDNFETRYLINEYAIKKNTPWIYAAVIGGKGFTMNIVPKKTPCFRCIFKEPTALLGTCETEGILNTIPSVISAMQVTEAIKILINQDYNKELISYNIWDNTISKIKIKKLKNCPACNKKFEYLTGEKFTKIIKICGKDLYQVYGEFNFNELAKKLKKIGNTVLTKDYLKFNSIFVFKDRVLIKAKNYIEAKNIFDKYLI